MTDPDRTDPDRTDPDRTDSEPTEPSDADGAGSQSTPGAVSTAEDAERNAEIEEAREREARVAARAVDATITQRFVASVTGGSVLITFLAIVSALIVGAVVIALSDEATRDALAYVTARPSDTFAAAWEAISSSYAALLSGSVGGLGQISETLVAATPLILTGLAVAIPFRAGLFNIGAEGQLIAGGLLAALVGFSFSGLPLVIHLPMAVLAGLLGGAALGWLPGFLKARTGAHEVISTIMLNNIAILVTNFALTTVLFRRPDRADPISPSVEPTATLPRLPFLEGQRVNTGLILALVIAAAVF